MIGLYAQLLLANMPATATEYGVTKCTRHPASNTPMTPINAYGSQASRNNANTYAIDTIAPVSRRLQVVVADDDDTLLIGAVISVAAAPCSGKVLTLSCNVCIVSRLEAVSRCFCNDTLMHMYDTAIIVQGMPKPSTYKYATNARLVHVSVMKSKQHVVRNPSGA
jgi:hypothetical protein